MEKIAIVGLSCLFPDAQNPEVFWQNLMAGKDSTAQARVAEFGVDPTIFFEPTKGNPDKTYSLKGGFIRDFEFDPTGYHLSPEVIRGLDPLAQGALYAARQALQHSGDLHNEGLRSRCGVILGNLSLPTRASQQLFAPMYQQVVEPAVQALLHSPEFHLRSLRDTPVDAMNARVSSLPSTVVAQALSLSSVNFSLDAACSSSLYAIKLAGDYLRSGQTDMMLAGAVSYADSLFIRMLFSGIQAYPDNGVSRPFDQRSRGLTPADGVGMVVLKRYSDAVRDRNTIYGVVTGVGVSNDGRGKHLLSPNQKGQVLAFERAYDAAGLEAQAIDYLECHATGTLLGDTTELGSIDTFFSQQGARPLMGAAKANVGHLLTAAGMVSLLKVLLAMEKGTIPPTLHLETPQVSPGGGVSPAQIVQQSTPWPQTTGPKRAAISAFGFGGTNAHLILEQPVLEQPVSTDAASPESPVELPPLAIVGMDAHFGGCEGLDAFDRSLYDGTQQFRPLPEQRWQGVEKTDLLSAYGLEAVPNGAYLDPFEIDALRFKIPPNEVHKLHPQQLLMLKVADQALQDAGLTTGGNVAVIVAMETELSIHQLQQRCLHGHNHRHVATGSQARILQGLIGDLEHQQLLGMQFMHL
ncbi:MAG: beta-ketoacyl synthase N-terminal-like domain-containing protein, partial [Cyanobacteria bacterium P01_F01_bin.4]